jgi:hypothetical protein
MKNDFGDYDEPDETSSKKLRVRMLKNSGKSTLLFSSLKNPLSLSPLDLLRSFHANFEFHHYVTKENTIGERNEIKSLGKINVKWSIAENKDLSHVLLQWHSSKDLRIEQKTFKSNEQSFTIGK